MEKKEAMNENQMAALACRIAIDEHIDDYASFAHAFMSHEEIEQKALALLPFDGNIQANVRLHDDNCQIAEIGLVIMRMDMEDPIFTFGIVLEFKPSNGDGQSYTSISYITACMTLPELREWFTTYEFIARATKHFYDMIDRYFGL